MVNSRAIRTGEASDLETLIDTLSDSFARDPMLNWVIPQTHFYPHYFRLLLQEVYLSRGLIHLERRSQAVALWLPPEARLQTVPRLAFVKLMLRSLTLDGLQALLRLHQQGQVFTRYLPTEPHYYLQFIGCPLKEQGRGAGSALLQHGTDICDERGMPAYLESSNSRNVPLYERHGFEVIGEERVGKNGPAAWFMWREAR